MNPISYENWLNDTLVGIFCSVAMDLSLQQSTIVLHQFWASRIDSDRMDHASAKRWFATVMTRLQKINVTSQSFSLWLFPFNKDRHWWLFAVNCTSQEVIVYDSLAGEDPTIASQLGSENLATATKLLTCVETLRGNPSVQLQDWKIRMFDDMNVHMPQQSNGNDCGLFVCFVILLIVRGHSNILHRLQTLHAYMPLYRERTFYGLTALARRFLLRSQRFERLGIRGCVNGGNNVCYLNSLIQAIATVIPQELVINDPRTPVLRTVSNCIRTVRTQGPPMPYAFMQKLVQQLGFTEGTQQSPHDALMILLRKTNEERQNNALYRVFSFQQSAKILYSCDSETCTTETKETSNMILLPLRDVNGNIWPGERPSLFSLLVNWYQEIPLDVNFRRTCAVHTCAARGQQHSILGSRLPHCFAFYIVREYYQQGLIQVDARPVAIEQSIDLAPFKLEGTWTLCAVLHKYGSANQGHYVATCLKDDKWYMINDERVQEVQDGTSIGDLFYACMTFYVRS
jgi:hypothetical protein